MKKSTFELICKILLLIILFIGLGVFSNIFVDSLVEYMKLGSDVTSVVCFIFFYACILNVWAVSYLLDEVIKLTKKYV